MWCKLWEWWACHLEIFCAPRPLLCTYYKLAKYFRLRDNWPFAGWDLKKFKKIVVRPGFCHCYADNTKSVLRCLYLCNRQVRAVSKECWKKRRWIFLIRDQASTQHNHFSLTKSAKKPDFSLQNNFVALSQTLQNQKSVADIIGILWKLGSWQICSICKCSCDTDNAMQATGLQNLPAK